VLLFVVIGFLRREYSRMAGVFFLLVWNASALICYYAADLRDYTLALCFVSLACVSAARIVKDTCDVPSKKPYLVLLVCVSGAAYTHYFAALLVVIGCGILFLHLWMNDRRKVPLLLLTGAASILSILPWMKTSLAVVSAVSGNYFLPPAVFRNVVNFASCVLTSGIERIINSWWEKGCYAGVSFGLTFAFIVSIIVFCRSKKTQNQKFAFCFLALFILYFLFLVSYSFAVRNIMLPRYILFGVVPFYVFVATQLARVRKRAIAALMGASLFASMVCNFGWTIQHRRFANWLFDYYFIKIAKEKGPDDVFFMDWGNILVDHERLIYSAFYPKSRHLHRGNFLPSPDGLGDLEHYQRVYNVSFVNVETLSDWSRFDSVSAYVFLWPDAQLQRFEQVLGDHARLLGEVNSCRLYRVSPASKLRGFFNGKGTVSNRSREGGDVHGAGTGVE
jgi:hypothetical protein